MNHTSFPIFHYFVPVWGQAFTQLFSEMCLPSLLCSGNLVSSLCSSEDKFIIATTYKDAAWLNSQPTVMRLRSAVAVEFVFVDHLLGGHDTHRAMTLCYFAAMKRFASESNHVFNVYLTPDSVWSSQTFTRLRQIAASGMQAVLIAGLRANKEKVEEILSNMLSQQPPEQGFQASDLLSIALDNLHQMSAAHDVFNPKFLNSWPSHIYCWAGSNTTLCARCFHLHPVMVKASPRSLACSNVISIDDNYLKRAGVPLEKCYVVTSIQDFFCMELSPADRSWNQHLGRINLSKIKEFAAIRADHYHRSFFQKNITYTTNTQYELSTNLLEKQMQEYFDYISSQVAESFIVKNRCLYSILAVYNIMLRKWDKMWSIISSKASI